MFTLAKETIWTWPVVVRLPKDGDIEEGRFRAKFRLAPDALRHAIGQSYTEQDVQERTVALIEAALIEVYDLVDEAGTPLALTPETRAALLGNSFILRGLAEAYGNSLHGKPTPAELGNSAQSGAPG